MLYGSEVIRNFILGMIMDKFFANSWDDIWLAFNLAISQRAMLLEYKKNQISEIKKLKEKDEEFNAIYEKFCDNPFDVIILKEVVNCIQNLYIRRLFLVRAIMKVVRNTVGDVRFIITTMVCSVFVAATMAEASKTKRCNIT